MRALALAPNVSAGLNPRRVAPRRCSSPVTVVGLAVGSDRRRGGVPTRQTPRWTSYSSSPVLTVRTPTWVRTSINVVRAATEDDDAAAAAAGGSSSSSAKSTLSALDSLLGKNPTPDDDVEDDYDDDLYDDEPAVIRVPLLWMTLPGQQQQRQGGGGGGGVAAALSDVSSSGDVYAAITVGLPDRATKSQQERGVKGVELDFCIDTACTTNFILPQVAYGLDMQIVGTSPAGTGATGAIGGGQEMLLGTAKLGKDGGEDGTGVVALTGLSAAVVPVPTPGTAGIMGRSFLNCFGAVAFDWSTRQGASVSFYQEYDWEEEEEEGEGEGGGGDGLRTVSLNELPCGLLSVDVTLNGVRMPALLDTGAPQTIINRAAAAAAGIDVNGTGAGGKTNDDDDDGESDGNKNNNPFAGLFDAFNKGKERALQDKGVMVMGAGGKPERLDRVDGAAADLAVVTASGGGGGGAGEVTLRCASVLVGELQAFQAGLGLIPPSEDGATDGAPGVVLGLDALMSRPKVVIGTTPGVTKMQL